MTAPPAQCVSAQPFGTFSGRDSAGQNPFQGDGKYLKRALLSAINYKSVPSFYGGLQRTGFFHGGEIDRGASNESSQRHSSSQITANEIRLPEAAVHGTNGQDSPLDSLPTELVEKVAEQLELADLANLRLTCRGMAAKCNGPHFKSYFHSQATDLCAQSLARLGAITADPTFGPAIKRLTVTAAVYSYDYDYDYDLLALEDTDPSEPDSEDSGEQTNNRANLRWIRAMSKAQSDEEASGHASVIIQLTAILQSLGTLESLNLMSVLVTGPHETRSPEESLAVDFNSWNSLWHRTEDVFIITMTDMARSQVQTAVFRVYQTTPRFTVNIGGITSLLSSPHMKGWLANATPDIEEFGLSFWTNLAFETEKNEGIAALLSLLKAQLERLDLHMFNTVHVQERQTTTYDRIFTRIAHDTTFPNLSRCVLRGIYTTEASLLEFLVWLTHGNWTAIFAHLRGPEMPYLEYLRLHSLLHLLGGKLPFYLAPKDIETIAEQMPCRAHDALLCSRMSFPCTNNRYSIFAREFTGGEVLQRGLEFRSEDKANLIPLDSEGFDLWSKACWEEFGLHMWLS
ncbi:hypothetical protein B0H66DRAFT_588807 [Apodospora peruviana]|uniref:F-box domain-containing protein n=1 Tax=Apodospora peruviana TaxID=516989 RepID=A0AAE0IKS5_9PEZI|nr:hypothetical protein B0H66DRAFT_588807 [Apodospora peruviana]